MGHCITRSLCYSLDAVGTSVFRSSTWTRCAGLDLHPNSWWENPQEGYKCKLLGVSRIISRNSISGWFFRFAVRCQSQSILKSHLELWAGWRVEFPTRPIPQWLWFLLNEWPNQPFFLDQNTRWYHPWWYSHHIPIYPHSLHHFWRTGLAPIDPQGNLTQPQSPGQADPIRPLNLHW